MTVWLSMSMAMTIRLSTRELADPESPVSLTTGATIGTGSGMMIGMPGTMTATICSPGSASSKPKQATVPPKGEAGVPAGQATGVTVTTPGGS